MSSIRLIIRITTFIQCFLLILTLRSHANETISYSQDSTHFRAMLVECNRLLYRNLDSAFLVAANAKSLAERLNVEELNAELNYTLGSLLFSSNKYDSVVALSRESVSIFKANKNDQSLAKVYVLLGGSFLRLGVYDSSIYYQSEAADILKASGSDLYYIPLLNKARALSKMESHKEALATCHEVETYLSETQDKVRLLNLYLIKGEILFDANPFSELILDNFEKASVLAKEVNNLSQLSYVYNNVGIWYANQNNYDSAFRYYRLADGIEGAVYSDSTFTLSRFNIAHSLYENQKYNEAIALLETLSSSDVEWPAVNSFLNLLLATSYARVGNFEFGRHFHSEALKHENNNYSLNDKQRLYKLNSEYYDAMGLPEEALRQLQLSEACKDSINRIETGKQLSEFELKFDSQLNETKIMGLQLESEEYRSQIIFLSSIILLLIVLTFTLYLFYIKKKALSRVKQQLSTAEFAKVKSELRVYTKTIIDKNQKIVSLESKLQELDLKKDSHQELRKTDLINKPILTNEDWFNFKQKFSLVYPNFFNEVLSKFSGITNSELRVFALAKLGLTNYEMALIIGVSPKSVGKIKYRLSIKIGVPSKEITRVAGLIGLDH